MRTGLSESVFQAITPVYIDNRIKCIEVIRKLDVGDVINVIRNSSQKEAESNLMTRFKITEPVAEFILSIALSDVRKFFGNEQSCTEEIAQLRALKELDNRKIVSS